MSVTEKTIDFNSLEKLIFEKQCREGCKLLKEKLEQYGEDLKESRDKSIYRHKGLKKTTIKTIMGEVEYTRALYEVVSEDGIKKYVYLLDQAMGINGSGFMSGLLSGLIVKTACEGSYRSTSRIISETTGQPISHTAAWNVVQEIGNRIGIKEANAAEAAANNEGAGELETPLLFEEMDGIWLNLQGKSRKEFGRNREMKLSIAYDGAERKGAKRYQLTNKVACAGFLPVGAFMKHKEGVIAGTYNTDEIRMRLLNGDGASWIKSGITDESVHFQLDQYHINNAIRKYVKNREMQKMITEYLYAKKIDGMLECIMLLSDSVSDDDEQDNLLSLYDYFSSNKSGLIPCHRRGLPIPPPSEGKVYRRLGAMESNVFTLVGNRMKGRRFCWSIDGGNNMARILCLKVTGKLNDTLQSLTKIILPEKYAENIFSGLSAAKVPQLAGKGYEGYHKSFAPPKPEYKWLRGIGSMNLGDLI
ncbi:MAG: ISLre2 family transposase [Clostridiales bacterium]|jgi:hypothetical protein|nr:ISLre2 family transposase [Clostridiales bacterium]